MKKMAILILILCLSMFPMNAYAGGSSGPNGPSQNTGSTGAQIAFLVVLGGGLIYLLTADGNKVDENGQPVTKSTEEEYDVMQVFAMTNDPNNRINPKGEFVVFRW
jgi:hypothetical protein